MRVIRAIRHTSGGAPSRQLLGSIQNLFVSESFDHPGLMRYHQWDLRNTADIRPFLKHIPNAENRQLVERVIKMFEETVLPVYVWCCFCWGFFFHSFPPLMVVYPAPFRLTLRGSWVSRGRAIGIITGRVPA